MFAHLMEDGVNGEFSYELEKGRGVEDVSTLLGKGAGPLITCPVDFLPSKGSPST